MIRLRFIFIILTLFINIQGCSQVEETPVSNLEQSITDSYINNKIISYCAKEISSINYIYYHYPQLKYDNSGNVEINELIVEYVRGFLDELEDEIGVFNGNIKDSPENVEWNWERGLCSVFVDYKITLFDDAYLSIVFEGILMGRFAAHPLNYFDSLVIDLHKKEIVSISDLYDINENFTAIAYRALKEESLKHGVAEGHEDMIYSLISDSLDDFLQSENSDKDSCKFFLTNKAVGICILVPFVMGKHWEIMIAYEDIAEY